MYSKELKIITVGGMIGVGKTTLINQLQKKLNSDNIKAKVLYEIWEDCDENIFTSKNTYDELMDVIIEMYYQNIEELDNSKSEEERIFHLNKLVTHQIHFLSTRTTKVFEAIHQAQNSDIEYLILDRTLYEDVIFTSLNLNDYPSLWKHYYEIWELWEAQLTYLLSSFNTNHIILDANIEVILQRIAKRGREFEQGDQVFKYFRNLNKEYVPKIIEQFNKKSISNFIQIDTTNKETAEIVNDVVQLFIK